tara:strand:- start:12713 stop:12916 length:204 start_codon:yes stop_codon:yes gene_type:complete
MDADFCPKQEVIILSTPKGLVLSTGKGQFIIQSTVAELRHEVDPVSMLSLEGDDACLQQTTKPKGQN